MVVGGDHVVEAGPPPGVAHPLEIGTALSTVCVAQVVERPGEQHPVLDVLCFGDGVDQPGDPVGTVFR